MKYTKNYTIYKIICIVISCLFICAGCSLGNDDSQFTPDITIQPGVTDNDSKIQSELVTNMGVESTLHPFSVVSEDTINTYSLIFEPAIQIDSYGNFEPALIDSWNIDEETGKIYTFHLKKGVKFHKNNGEMTSDDIVYTIDLIRTLDKTNSYTENLEYIASYRAVDTYTVEVIATEKTDKVLYFMNFPVLCKSYYQKKNLLSKELPIGTGPYYAESYDTSSGLVLKRNEDWWKDKPVFKTVISHSISGELNKLNSFKISIFDMISSSSITAGNVSNIATVTNYLTTEYETLVPNFSNKYLKNKNVRRAISLAINREEVISKSVYGQGLPAEIPIKPDHWSVIQTGKELGEYSVEQARELMNEAGYVYERGKVNFSLKLIACESDNIYFRQAEATVIKNQLAEIGIDVVINILDKEEYERELSGGNFDIAICSFDTRKDGDISFMFSNYNYGRFNDSSTALTLIKNCYLSTDSEERSLRYEALISYLKDSLPNIGLYYRCNALVYKSNIKGIKSIKYRDIFSDINNWYVE